MKSLHQSLGRSSTAYRWLAVIIAAILLVACQPVHPEVTTSSATTNEATAQPTEEVAEEATAEPSEEPAEENAEIPQITIKAQDFAFDMPDELPSGLVSITFTNEGKVNHHGYVAHMLEGVTLDQVMAAAGADNSGEQSGDEPPQLNDVAFFLPDTDPGKSNQATVELIPGNWFIISFSMDPASGDPAPDFVKGSIKEFTVIEAGDSAAASAAAPEADTVVTIDSDDFDMPAELAAGEHTIQVVNDSDADDGYIFFVKLGGDTTIEDVRAAFEAMFSGQEVTEVPEVSAVGGLMGYSVGNSYYTTINLEPGNYAAISSIGGDGFPYNGLYKNFTVK